jgi:signal transduction histidine kinase
MIERRNAADSADARDAATIVDVTERLVSQSDKARALEALIGDTGETEAIDLASVVRHEVGVVRREYPAVTVETDLPERQPVEVNPGLDAAVRGVLDNAARHNDADDPTVSVSLAADGETATLTVADNGPGVPDHEIDVIEADAETKLDHGSGLGLWLVAWVVTESDGDLRIETGDRRGTTVVLSFPVARDTATVTAHPEAERRSVSV